MSRNLSKREQALAAIVGAVLVVGASLMFGSSYLAKRSALEAKIATERKQLRTMRDVLSQRAFWEAREKWLIEKQPKLDNADTAGVELLDYVQKLAKKHSVVLENPAIHSPENRPDCVSVVLEVETKSPWPPLVSFLGELQSPEQFVAIENADVKKDGSDETQMRGRFKIARWYAPN